MGQILRYRFNHPIQEILELGLRRHCCIDRATMKILNNADLVSLNWTFNVGIQCPIFQWLRYDVDIIK